MIAEGEVKKLDSGHNYGSAFTNISSRLPRRATSRGVEVEGGNTVGTLKIDKELTEELPGRLNRHLEFRDELEELFGESKKDVCLKQQQRRMIAHGTRPKLICALEALDTKRDQNAPKKLGSVPSPHPHCRVTK